MPRAGAQATDRARAHRPALRAGRRYSEDEVNAALRTSWADVAALRRYLVDAGAARPGRRACTGASAGRSERVEQYASARDRVARRRAAVPRHAGDRRGGRAAAAGPAGRTTCPPGQPSTPAPAPVRAAAARALDTDRIGYTNALGIPPLRAAIAGHYRDRVRHRRRPGERRGHHRLVRRLPATRSSPRSTPATPSCWPGPATRPTATCSPRSAAACVELPCGPETRFQPTVAAARRAATSRRPAWSSPARPTRPARWSRPTSSPR